MKRSTKQFSGAVLSVGCSMLLTAAAAFPCNASSLPKDELAEKYAAQLRMWTESGILSDAGTEWTKTDENGVGGNGIDYGAALSDRVLYLYGDYCVWDEQAAKTVFVGDFAESNHFYYVTKADESLCLVGPDYDYFAEQRLKTLIIPSELNGAPVTEIGSGFLMTAKVRIPTLREISVPDSITVIQPHAFDSAFGADSAGCRINIPDKVISLGAFSYGQLGNALGSRTILPETLEYLDYSTFGTATYTELVLPETNVVCLPGCIRIQPSEQSNPETLRFGENCVTADDAVFGRDAAEEIPKEAGERRGQPAQQAAYPVGDLDENGEVNVLDAVMLARVVNEDTECGITENGKHNADINGDGSVTPQDLTALLKQLAE